MNAREGQRAVLGLSSEEALHILLFLVGVLLIVGVRGLLLLLCWKRRGWRLGAHLKLVGEVGRQAHVLTPEVSAGLSDRQERDRLNQMALPQRHRLLLEVPDRPSLRGQLEEVKAIEAEKAQGMPQPQEAVLAVCFAQRLVLPINLRGVAHCIIVVPDLDPSLACLSVNFKRDDGAAIPRKFTLDYLAYLLLLELLCVHVLWQVLGIVQVQGETMRRHSLVSGPHTQAFAASEEHDVAQSRKGNRVDVPVQGEELLVAPPILAPLQMLVRWTLEVGTLRQVVNLCSQNSVDSVEVPLVSQPVYDKALGLLAL